ncbi:DODA-type extradiol aromatic ring-opening family dioxygenase [Kitasatospora sp. NPDC004531]
MATVITGIGSSHGPQLKTPPAGWPERGLADRRNPALEFQGRTYDFAALKALREDFSEHCTPEAMQANWDASQAAMDRLGRHLADADVDVLVIVSSDHKEVYGDELLPAFAVYWGEDVAHVPFTEEQLAAMAPGLAEAALGDVPQRTIVRPCHSELARHLVEQAGEAGFDVAASRTLPSGRYANHGIPHGWGFIYQRILGEACSIPFVPVFVNTFYEPNPPTAARSYRFGRALGRSLTQFPQDLRIGVVASGGLSHFVIDEELDRCFLDALEAGDEKFLTSIDPALMRSGTSELRNWITVAGIAAETGLAVDSAEYHPCYRTEAGTGNAMGFVTWSRTDG